MTQALTQLASLSQDVSPTQLPSCEVPGLYVHVPFCFHKCHYCDFYSITRQTPERMVRFVDLILKELDQWLTPPLGPVLRPKTVFFGGGTPSLLPLTAMRLLLEGLKSRLDFSEVNEWTIECNPATVSLEYCAMLHDQGVDRLSFGAQSFDRAQLAKLERHHDPDDVPKSIALAREAGFTRLNADLIYAIPGQDLESWADSLRQAIDLGVPHLSCYGLTYEANTPIAVKKRLGLLRPTEDSIELEMLHYTRRALSATGRPPYEISNYASPGEACRHNLLYWTGGSYIGLGPSAASHVAGHRFRNRPHLREWESAVESGMLPATDYEVLTPRQRAGELAMLELRLTEGVRFATFRERIGFDANELFAPQLAELSKLELITVDSEGFRLTEKGLDVADAIAGQFVLP